MNLRRSFHVVGIFLKFFGLLFLIPIIPSFIYGDGKFHVFWITALITASSGATLKLATKEPGSIVEIGRKEAFFIAFTCWMAASLFGALPYLFIGVSSSPMDALFESVSGYTTTGATVISNVESLPHGILFYRGFTQWLGGMGIIILCIAVLPKLSVGGMQLMSLEAPGPTTEKLTPHVAKTAKSLWLVYIILSVILIALLYFAGMPIFDAIATSFSTVSTGGFSVNNGSIGGYGNPFIEFIIILFMILGATNFLLLYYFFTGKFSKLLKSSELKFFASLLVAFVLLVSVELWLRHYPSYLESLRYASFQIISIMTGTGFSTTDPNLWTKFAVFALLILMFVGGCAGSTTGSIKVIRILVLIKKGIREINHLIKPHAILPLRIDKRAVSDDIASGITSFFLLYIAIFILSVLVILLVEDISIMGALSLSAATIGNVGPGFEEVGATRNYQFLSDFSKLWTCFLMLLGRLELYAILVFFSPMFWKR